ncbi:MAG: nucleotide exchange factor GrpE [Deltaproteobacteria bacterium]|nr:nucleotide exchange factor GrpE [Deltaproteobacteria bacterium]NIS77925.1 nucleotide exchange factor GrpE [Deltaproteobacteria bacterium]
MSGEKKDRDFDNTFDERENELAAVEEVPAGGDEREPEETIDEALERLTRENEELSNRILYVHAELDNFKKRTAKEREQLVAFGNERLIKELIPVLDSLELGLVHGREEGGDSQLLSGVELTYNEFLKVLKKFGVVQLDAGDEGFDPNFHEAVSSIAVPDREAGTIYQVIRKGYMLNGRLLRPVQVVVVAEPDGGTGEEGGLSEDRDD